MKTLTEPERWHWLAYDHGLAACMGWSKAPLDPYREWYAPDLAAAAEKFWRRKLNRPARKSWWPIPAADVVRPNWREIPAPMLTDAEHAIADPLIAAMARQAIINIKAFVEKSKKAFEEPEPAKEIPPP